MSKNKRPNSWMILLLLALIILYLGCKPTPKEEIVTPKENTANKFESFSLANDESLLDYASMRGNHISKQFTLKNGLVVTIDANIDTPKSNSLPIVHIAKGAFSQGTLRLVHYVLCNNQESVVVFPKAARRPDLDSLLALKETGSLGKYDTEQELDNAISVLYRAIEDLPDKAITEPVDLSFHNGYFGMYFVSDEPSQTIGSLSILEEEYICYYQNYYDAKLFDKFLRTPNPISYLQPFFDKGRIHPILPSTSLATALQTSQDLIDQLGISNEFMYIGNRLAPLYESLNNSAIDECPCAYEFIYTRQLNDIHTSFNNQIQSSQSVDMETYNAPWRYEKIQVFVDDSGVRAFLWTGPYEVLNTTVQNSKLLSFDDIMQRFQQMIGVKLAATDSASVAEIESIDVERIELGLVRVLEKNAKESAFLIPAWTFYGITKKGSDLWYMAEGYGYDGYDSILIINAMDGSIIDPATGY